MNIEDVVKLIECCKNAGVSKLKFEKLELQFIPSDPAPARAVLPNQSYEHPEIETRLKSDDDLNDLELQNLMISDPLEYELQLRKAPYAAQDKRSERDVHEE